MQTIGRDNHIWWMFCLCAISLGCLANLMGLPLVGSAMAQTSQCQSCPPGQLCCNGQCYDPSNCCCCNGTLDEGCQ